MAGVRTIRCLVEYDGSAFRGFQRQGRVAGAGCTVQAVLEEAVLRLTGERVQVVGAGRTDAGVHATGQVVHFRTASRLPPSRWAAALNSVLPPEVAVPLAEEAPPGFHARRSAVGKVYRYTLWNAPTRSPFWHGWAWHVPRALDLEAMNRAAARVTGRRDFAAFRAAGSSARTSVRTLRRLEVVPEPRGRGRLLHVWAEADGFLYRMVRLLVGSLVEVGRGRRAPAWLEEVLAARGSLPAGPAAPACGLCLVEVHYRPPFPG